MTITLQGSVCQDSLRSHHLSKPPLHNMSCNVLCNFPACLHVGGICGVEQFDFKLIVFVCFATNTMKLWERKIERRLRSDLTFSNQQYGFMPGKSTTDALFALRVLMEKYRDGQKELHCVFVDLEKAYDKVPRKEVWYCTRESLDWQRNM